MRGRVLFLAPLVLLGCDDLQTLGTGKYTLEAKTEIKFGGIRQYAETEYVFRRDGEEVWRQTRREKYAHHWITKDGRVWIISSSMPGPGGGGALSLLDSHGKPLGGWGLSEVFRGRPPREADYEWCAPERLEMQKSGTSTLRKGVERLRLFAPDGFEFQVDAVELPGEQLFGYQRSIAPGTKEPSGPWDEVLKDATYLLPERKPIGDENRHLFLMTAKGAGKPPRFWLQQESETYGGWFRKVSHQIPLESEPARIDTAPNGQLLVTVFDTVRKPGSARLRVLGMAGETLANFDLLKFGGFGDAEEAKKKLQWEKPTVPFRDGFVPLAQSERRGDSYGSVFYTDEDGRRWALRMQPTGAPFMQVLSGYAARLPEDYDAGVKALEEWSVRSPSGRFRARMRWYPISWGPKRLGNLTLLVKMPEKGQTTEVVLWSQTFYTAPEGVQVSDSGRTLWFDMRKDIEVGRIVPGTDRQVLERRDNASLMVFKPDGGQIGGIDLLEPQGIKSVEEARQTFDLAHLRIESKGRGTQEVKGLTLPAAQSEAFVLPRFRSEAARLTVFRFAGGETIRLDHR